VGCFRYRSLFFASVGHEKREEFLKPWSAGWRIAFDGRFLKGFEKNLQKTPSAQGIPSELLVRFLWANKENEQR
jgi:hypothetical protein